MKKMHMKIEMAWQLCSYLSMFHEKREEKKRSIDAMSVVDGCVNWAFC